MALSAQQKKEKEKAKYLRRKALGLIKSVVKTAEEKEANRKKLSESRKGKGNPMYGRKKENSTNWRGGKITDKYGYVQIHYPEHPNSVNGYIAEHRMVMEKYVGRMLTNKEAVHHINGNKSDNRIENLMLLSRGEHQAIHNKLRKRGI